MIGGILSQIYQDLSSLKEKSQNRQISYLKADLQWGREVLASDKHTR